MVSTGLWQGRFTRGAHLNTKLEMLRTGLYTLNCVYEESTTNNDPDNYHTDTLSISTHPLNITNIAPFYYCSLHTLSLLLSLPMRKKCTVTRRQKTSLPSSQQIGKAIYSNTIPYHTIPLDTRGVVVFAVFSAYLHTHVSTYSPIYILTYLHSHLSTYAPIYFLAYLPSENLLAFSPTYLPTYLFTTTTFLFSNQTETCRTSGG